MHNKINVYCQENVLLSTGRQMYLGNLDNIHVFRSDKQSQMSCIRLQEADMTSLVVFTRESLVH